LRLADQHEVPCSSAACVMEDRSLLPNRMQPKSGFRAVRLFSLWLVLSVPSASLFANRYRDNPDRAVNQRAESWSSPVVQLETGRRVNVDGVQGIFRGTGFLVSPCYVVTAAHVVSPDSNALLDGLIDSRTDFRMVLRTKDPISKAAISLIADVDRHMNDLKVAYLRSSRFINAPMSIDSKDFVFLRLPADGCLGSKPNFGWFETSNDALRKGDSAVALGYPKSEHKGELHLGSGQIRQTTLSNLLEFSGSYRIGESGGPLLKVEDRQLKVAGLIVSHLGSNASQEYPTFSSDNANLVLSLAPILNYAPIKAVLDADKARFGNRNPAAVRQTTGELPK
jgi:hypothetical protein